jgi:hypothetical protein
MSFANHHLQLGRVSHMHKFQFCNKCAQMRPPEGGIELSATKWHCASCWTKRLTTTNLVQNAKTKTTGAAETKIRQDV